MSSTLLRRRALGAILALGLAASAAASAPVLDLAAPAAHAATGGGSIVYIKNHNVWIADGSGANQRQLIGGGTASNPWRSPTQSDGGVVVATRGDLIYRMNQRGAVYNTINPPALQSTGGEMLDGPMAKVAVSPDGAKIAFMYEYHSLGNSGIERTRWVTGITAATG
ncbi:MAG: hypothetical protein J0H64_00825, partial [Actinobacteria bacterium]|nr:hypothetical protein [Actinomycetota bacterium]